MSKLLKHITKELGGFRYASKGDEDFVAKHVIQLFDDPSGNGDDIFNGTIPPVDRKKDRHGYNPGEDTHEYNKANVDRKAFDAKNRRKKLENDRYRNNLDSSDTVDYAHYVPKGDVLDESSFSENLGKKFAKNILQRINDSKKEPKKLKSVISKEPEITEPEQYPEHYDAEEELVDTPEKLAHKNHAKRFYELYNKAINPAKKREYLKGRNYHLNKLNESFFDTYNHNSELVNKDEYSNHHDRSQGHLEDISELLKNIHDETLDNKYVSNYDASNMKELSRRLEDMLSGLKNFYVTKKKQNIADKKFQNNLNTIKGRK